jgi:hypothetical protein
MQTPLERLADGAGIADDLAAVLGMLIFDVEDAARLLGVEKTSLYYAAYRHRIAYVQYGTSKFFARDDLITYAMSRGRGRDSRIQRQPHFVVRPSGWHARWER